MHRPEATGLVPVLRHLQDWVVMGQALGGFPIVFRSVDVPEATATLLPLTHRCSTTALPAVHSASP